MTFIVVLKGWNELPYQVRTGIDKLWRDAYQLRLEVTTVRWWGLSRVTGTYVVRGAGPSWRYYPDGSWVESSVLRDDFSRRVQQIQWQLLPELEEKDVTPYPDLALDKAKREKYAADRAASNVVDSSTISG